MGMYESFLYCMRNYFKFSGRGSLSEFWWFQLIVWILGSFTLFIVLVPFIIPIFAAGSRRLHDTGRSGWLQLLILIPFLGALILIFLFAQKPDPMENRYGVPIDHDSHR